MVSSEKCLSVYEESALHDEPSAAANSQMQKPVNTKSYIKNGRVVSDTRTFYSPQHNQTHTRYFTPQPARKTYSEQLEQVKLHNLRHLAVLSDEDVFAHQPPRDVTEDENTSCVSAHRRRFSLATTNLEVDYSGGYGGGSSENSSGLLGGMFSCLRPVWAMMGRRSTGSIQTTRARKSINFSIAVHFLATQIPNLVEPPCEIFKNPKESQRLVPNPQDFLKILVKSSRFL